MELSTITGVILTYNESENISRALAPLGWCRRIVVLDSGSTDDSVGIASSYPNVEVHHRAFDTHTAQWNHALDLVQTEWALTFDADYITTRAFAAELQALLTNSATNAYLARFIYCVHGTPLRASLYPPRAVLFRRRAARYIDDGHTQLLRFEGGSQQLATAILHDDRKPLSRWVRSQDNYARIEARHLLAVPTESLSTQDRLRRAIFAAPIVVLLYLLIAKGLILGGWRGWYYVCQRTIAELLLSLYLMTERHALERVRPNPPA